MSDIVPAHGRQPNDVLFIGKAPAAEECAAGRPFVGRSGREQKAYCDRHGLSMYSFRLANLVPEFTPPDEKLTPARIAQWEHVILREIEATRPRLIVPIGSDATKFLLGPSATLSACRGIPHRPDAFGPSSPPSTDLLYSLPSDCTILPVTQPAAGFHSPDTRASINWDFSQVSRVLDLIRHGLPIDYREDKWAGGLADYRDVTGRELKQELLFWSEDPPPVIALDTEGTPADHYSIQICFEEGLAYLLRSDQPDFSTGIEALQECARRGSTFTGHNIGMYDLQMFRAFRPTPLDLFHAKVHDTLFHQYLLNLEPLGLKPSAWRYLGARMKSHTESVGELGRDLQIEWLRVMLSVVRDWPKPDPFPKLENDGTVKLKSPNTLASRIRSILSDIEKGEGSEIDEEDSEDEEDGEDKLPGVDPVKRWKLVKRDIPHVAKQAEQLVGRLPYGTMRELGKRDFNAMLRYACDDAHSSFRILPITLDRLEREGKTHLADVYSSNMHVFSEMQENGLPAIRSRFEALAEAKTEEMLALSYEISQTYNDGQPYNPKSSPQTAKLFSRWGLKPLTKTKKRGKDGKRRTDSYGKKSVDYLKFTDESMSPEVKHARRLAVLRSKWLEAQHTRDAFCRPVLARVPEDQERCRVRCQILPWGTPSRRLRAKDPNQLAVSKHAEDGHRVRDCYEAPPGYVFLESDLASIEVCVMAHMTQDQQLIKTILSGVHFHTSTASHLFEIPFSTVDGIQKLVAKRTIFGTFYGQTGPGLREQLWMSNLTQYDDEASQAFIDDVKYRVYPGIGKYEEAVERWLRKHGKIADLSGMERHLSGIWSDDRRVREEAVRHGVSMVIQGTAQALIQEAISWLKDEIRKLQDDGIDVQWLLTVHDSLLLLSPEWAVDIVRELVEEGLTQHCGIKLRVPVRAESKTARTWGQL